MPEEQKDPRAFLAAERTLLAWIRTGLALMGFGFVVARFGLFLREIEAAGRGSENGQPRLSLWFGIALVLMGVAVNITAAINHRRFLSQLRQNTWSLERADRTATIVAAALACAGIVVAVYLLAFR